VKTERLEEVIVVDGSVMVTGKEDVMVMTLLWEDVAVVLGTFDDAGEDELPANPEEESVVGGVAGGKGEDTVEE